MWYVLLSGMLPPIAEPISLGRLLFLSKGGFAFPVPVWTLGQTLALCGAVVGLAGSLVYRRWALRQFEMTGRIRSLFWTPVAMIAGSAVVGWLAGGAPTGWSVPVPQEFAMEGGAAITPEFLGVLLGLVLYTAAFIAEVVRSGIQSVARGQTEAALSLGLSSGQTMRLVSLPQALRVVIPPVTSQYLNLTKNSSLAVAIGYPDVVSIANTSLSQTGRAVECIAIIMLVYLTTSLSTATLMNWYNRRSAIKER